MNRALILMYHAIDEPRSAAEARFCVTPAAFHAQMAHLAGSGYTLISLAVLVNAIKSGNAIPVNSVVVTFDDGFECFRRNALPVLTEFRIPATLFAVAGLLGEKNFWMQAKDWPERRLMSTEDIRSIHGAGVTIGCHALTHMPMTTMSNAQLVEETAGARRILSDALNTDVCLFAYPHGAQGERERRAVADAGFIAACSTDPGFNRSQADLFALRRIDVYGDDSLSGFRRKLQFGANHVSLSDIARYYLNRIVSPFHV
ncbi:MAG: polysaccharide deacetylase family protein [Sulfuricella sp.]